MMNKYIKPEITVFELNSEAPLLAGSGENRSLDTGNPDTSNATEGLSRESPSLNIWGASDEEY